MGGGSGDGCGCGCGCAPGGDGDGDGGQGQWGTGRDAQDSVRVMCTQQQPQGDLPLIEALLKHGRSGYLQPIHSTDL